MISRAASRPPTKFYSTYATFDIITGRLVARDRVSYGGPWYEAKKGRETMGKVGETGLANAAANTAKQNEQYGLENTALNDLTAKGANGLGLGASGYLANQLNQIGRVYGNARQNAARVNATRGFAGTPEGAFQSGLNSANLGQADAENRAYNDAQMLTRENMLEGVRARQGLQTLYDPNAPLHTALGGAQAQNQAGSLLGDIGKGIGTAASIATGVAGLPNAFKSGGW